MIWLPTYLKTERHLSVLGTVGYGIVVITVTMLPKNEGNEPRVIDGKQSCRFLAPI